jgi:5-methylcytosine-specific restriction endonuclease McrA
VEDTQRCSVCLEHKPLYEFHKNKNRKNGVSVTCKICAKSRSRAWEKNNPDRVNANSRRLYHKNLEESRAKRRIRVRKWYKNNSEKAIAATRDWNRRNPEHKRLSEHKRKSDKIGNGVFEVSKKEALSIVNSPCVSCGTSNNITIDHIIPLSRGGRHSIGNLQPLCFSCNASKNNRTMTEWDLSKGGK